MKKNKYTIVPISFSIISFIILLTSLLSGYFVSKNEIFKEIDSIYTQICNVIEEEGYTKLDKYIGFFLGSMGVPSFLTLSEGRYTSNTVPLPSIP